MSETNPDPPPTTEAGTETPNAPRSGAPGLRQSKPLPDFRPKPKSLGDVTDRLVANRHQDGRGPGWWARYGPWIAVGQLVVLGGAGLYLLVTTGVVLQVLLPVAGLMIWGFIRWLIASSDPN